LETDASVGFWRLSMRQLDVDIRHVRTRDVASRALRAGVERARRRGAPVLVSFTEPAPAIAPLELFARGRQISPDCLYWTRPGDGTALVGVGVTRRVTFDGPSRFHKAAGAWRDLLEDAVIEDRGAGAGPVLMGGFAFDPDRPATDLWAGFPAASLTLPRFSMRSHGTQGRLTCNVLVRPASDAAAEAARVEDDLRRLMRSPAFPGPLARAAAEGGASVEDVRPAGEWKALVSATTEAIRGGAFEKVVLARAARARGGPFEPAAVLGRLRDAYPTCTIFAVAHGRHCFLGATPERLVSLRDGEVRVSCLAGTIRRGATDDEDRRLGDKLLSSAKDRAEHAVVVRMATERLAGVCADLRVPAEPVLLKVRNVQHLSTPLIGRVALGEDVLSLVARLHPTPAVGGFPVERAMAFIRDREGLDRGWYAGPVGWLDHRGEGDFAVAIRSALLRPSADSGAAAPLTEAVLFAGCGIVAGSDPESEYVESCLKLQSMLAALDLAEQ
jgi:isochorismate synthase